MKLRGALGGLNLLIEATDTPTSLNETLQARRERWGLSYVVGQADAIDVLAPVVAALAGT